MISIDYSKSEDMAKDIFKTVNNMVMKVKETQNEFIFSTLNQYANDNFNIVVEKEELARAIQLIRLSKEYGPGIDERWITATQNACELDRSYRRGLQDGIDKEHKRIMNILEGEKKWEKS